MKRVTTAGEAGGVSVDAAKAQEHAPVRAQSAQRVQGHSERVGVVAQERGVVFKKRENLLGREGAPRAIHSTLAGTVTALGSKVASVSMFTARCSAGISILLGLASRLGFELLGLHMTALVYKRNDEYLAIAYVINDAPRVGGNLTLELIVEFGDFAADVGCGRDRVGPAQNLPRHRLGVLSGLSGDVVMKGLEVGASALRPTHRDGFTTARFRPRAPRSELRVRRRCPAVRHGLC